MIADATVIRIDKVLMTWLLTPVEKKCILVS
jgi:hypothetical protein